MHFTLGCQGFTGPNPSTFQNKFNNLKNAAQIKLDKTIIAIIWKKDLEGEDNLSEY